MHLEAGGLALPKSQSAIFHQLAVDDQGWKVKEANGDCWLVYVEEVLC